MDKVSGMPPNITYSAQPCWTSPSYACMNSTNDRGRTRTSSPRPRNSVITSVDSIFELLPVTYTSTLRMRSSPLSTPYRRGGSSPRISSSEIAYCTSSSST